jgi:PleD family two-component response regulator
MFKSASLNLVALRSGIQESARSLNVTTSIGLAERREPSDSHELYHRADQALYRSKAEGRNRVSADAA